MQSTKSVAPSDSLPIAEFASLFGFRADAIAAAVEAHRQHRSDVQAFFTISQLADRWVCSRAQVYAILRASAAKVLDIGEGKSRKKLLIPAEAVERLERTRMQKMK